MGTGLAIKLLKSQQIPKEEVFSPNQEGADRLEEAGGLRTDLHPHQILLEEGKTSGDGEIKSESCWAEGTEAEQGRDHDWVGCPLARAPQWGEVAGGHQDDRD